jgi:adenosylcobinamide kinase / adenosylcobinamide-phosphate guanylyltransferase
VDNLPGTLELVTGPARSGKSRWAEHRALSSGRSIRYLATGPQLPGDPSWQQRLERHRRRRPSHWHCEEVQFHLVPALRAVETLELVVVDSLGTWVSWALDLDGASWLQHCEDLLTALKRCPADVVLVSEQTGWGVVPPTPVGGLFRDRLGALEDFLSPHCHHLWLVVAGRAMDLMAISSPVPPL